METYLGYRSCRNCSTSGYDSPDYYCEEGPDCMRFKKKQGEILLLGNNDFGFSFIDDNAINTDTDKKEVEILKKRTKRLEDKIQGVVDMITPLLDNLMINPEKKTINWPNRVEKIQEFKQKLTDYINS